jgi:hypothetical protein
MKHNLKSGDTINFFTVEKIVKIEKNGKSMGNGVFLICECGEKIGPIAISRLYKRGKRPGVQSCKKCAYKITGESKRLYDDGQAKHAVFSRYKVGAKRRAISWNLSKEDFFHLISLSCVYCGESNLSFASNPKTSPWQKSFYYTGLDRIDSQLGYEINNVQPCCKWCNMGKSNRSEKEFLEWIDRIYERKQKNAIQK